MASVRVLILATCLAREALTTGVEAGPQCAGLPSCLQVLQPNVLAASSSTGSAIRGWADARLAASSSNGPRSAVRAWAAYLSAVYGEPVVADGALIAARVAQLEWFYRCRPGPRPFDPFDDKNYPEHVRQRNGRLPAPEAVRCALLPPNAPTSVVPRAVHLSHSIALGEAYVGANRTDGLQAHARFGFFVKRRSFPAPAARNTHLEVVRVRNRFEGGHLFTGTWYYAARGTGVFLNVGRTRVLRSRHPSHAEQQRIIKRALVRGYDTVQFAWVWRWGAHEIVDLRAAARSNRGSTCAAAIHLRAGAWAERACNCSEEQQLLNCGEARDIPP